MKKIAIILTLISLIVSLFKVLFVFNNAWNEYVSGNYCYHTTGTITNADDIDFVNGNPGRDYGSTTLVGKANGNEVILYNYHNASCDFVYTDGDNYSYAYNVDLANLSIDEMDYLTGEQKMSRMQYYGRIIKLTNTELKISEIVSPTEREANISFRRICHFLVISIVLIVYSCIRKKMSLFEFILILGIALYYTVTILLNSYYILIL